ncbi:hypothetical protein RvY_10862 [Ramazzottius varieornatus]|uniref:C3H1-type domain-containing protein n=1 Tax=Ramazzottius varieornatus TaxID=947166 RepID=A0A1D1VN47_RAMVA|nr:hypothetical protein RvY_10862 [Ramazzottius varieornatus]
MPLSKAADDDPKKGQTHTPCSIFDQRGSCSNNPCRYVHVCSKCGAKDHGAVNCGPKQEKEEKAKPTGPPGKNVDQLNICKAFNAAGCDKNPCKFFHKCKRCGATDHGATKCPKPANEP